MPEPVTLVAVGGGLIGLVAHLARRYFELAKEILDIVLGSFLLVLVSPVIAFCGILVKCASRGPVFFTQVRMGKDGKCFKMYKLRTMYVDAETATGAVWAASSDPRVIPVCRWMRFSHLDELPQLVNVIKGDMSLVGPRPERPEIVAELEKVYPDIRKRLAVRPGITGLAQIRNGYDTSIEGVKAKLTSDLEYIERRRWLVEFKILAATFSKLHDKSAH